MEGRQGITVQLTHFDAEGRWTQREDYFTQRVVLASGLFRPHIVEVKEDVRKVFGGDGAHTILISFEGEPLALVDMSQPLKPTA